VKANTSGKQRNIKVHKEWKFHRRVNTNNPVEHIVSHHSGNVFYLAAVGLDHGLTEVQLKQRSGRIHLTGVKFSDEDDGFSDSGFIHKDNIVGGGGVVPQGGIIMWSRSAANIPAGWALCNGSNETPGLRGRFVVGYSGSGSYAAVGNTGGSDSRTLTTANMPSHSHSGSIGNKSLTHNHSGSSSNKNLSHKHWMDNAPLDDKNFNSQGLAEQEYGLLADGNNYDTSSDSNRAGKYTTNALGDHNHTITVGNKSQSHSHTVTVDNLSQTHNHSITINNNGSGTAFDNRPAYYVVAFIMKV
jgi:hypothetical protein